MEEAASNNRSSAVSSSSASAVFRRIEFHPARKPWNGFSNKGGSDFKLETLNPSFSSANKQSLSSPFSVNKRDGSDSLEHGLDRALTFTITIRKIGAGLENLGNTCFLNSVLQCLTYTEPLAAYLQNVGHEKRCHVAGFCALCAMQKHVRSALQATGDTLAPKYLVSNLRCVSRNFRNGRQEDAHEYMINLLECMHKCSLPSGVPSESSDAYRSSLVHKIFGGTLRSRVQCAQCSHCSDKFDPFIDLSVDISKADSLQRALTRFTSVELLDDGAKVYQCERCKQKVKATKQLTVSKAPYVLALHLKRFEAHSSDKIDRKVEFPSAVDLKPFFSGPNEGNLKYTLRSVLVHYGRSIHSGHYSCFVRTSTSGMWYSLDDNKVSQVSEKIVFNQKAYMLFYVRDRQNTAPKNAPAMVKKESLATNRVPMVISSNRNDQVSGSTDMKASSFNGIGANGTTPLRSCNQGAQKDPTSSVDAKEILERKNGKAPLKSCDLGAATAGVSQRDSNSKENLQKELPLSQANGEGSLVKENIKAASATLPGKAEETLTTPRKTRRGKTNALQVGLRLFKLALGVRKKKKQKKGRSSTLAGKVISEELLSEKRAEDQERSTSEITSEVASGSSCSPGKSVHNERKMNSNGNMLLGSATTGDLNERANNQNGAVLASDQQPPLRSSGLPKASQVAKRKREPSKDEQIVLQKDELTILTRGLPETVVAKWDEEVSASKKMGTNEGTKIGYVADEWDEEYDRGKKKKIRIKEEMYAGPNPFQAFASKKQTDTKKKWTQRMNTAKTGFRK